MRVARCLTPPGRSAIATIQAGGFASVQEFDRYFRSAANKSIAEYPLGRIVFGNWTNLDGSSEELVVVRVSDSEIQIHCHGGSLPIQVILESLAEIGFSTTGNSQATVGETVRFDEELKAGLLNAPTRKIANLFMSLTHDGIQNTIAGWIAELESHPDSDSSRIIRRIGELRQTFAVGQFLVRPARIVLAGSPNVGKSSLNNQILGYDRSIILDKPGTTRDVVSARTTIDGWSFEFSDTAGLRQTTEQIEAEGIQFAIERIQRADLIVLVYSAENGLVGIEEQKQALEEQLGSYSGPTLSVINKVDLLGDQEVPDGKDPDTVLTQAVSGTGIDNLMQRIKDSVISTEPESSKILIFTSRQLDVLQESIVALESSDTQQAIEILKTF